MLLGSGMNPDPDGSQVPPLHPCLCFLERPGVLRSAVTNVGALLLFFGNKPLHLGNTVVYKGLCGQGMNSQLGSWDFLENVDEVKGLL